MKFPNPIAALKAAWHNPKKRPWIIAGVGAAAGAGALALRRPTDPAAATAEDTAAADAGATDPSVYDPNADTGAIPPIYSIPGGSGFGVTDPAFQEADLSGVYSQLDDLAASQSAEIESAVDAATGDLKKRARAAQRAANQAKRQQERTKERLQKSRQAQKKLRHRVSRIEKRVTNQRQRRQAGPIRHRPPQSQPKRKRARR